MRTLGARLERRIMSERAISIYSPKRLFHRLPRPNRQKVGSVALLGLEGHGRLAGTELLEDQSANPNGCGSSGSTRHAHDFKMLRAEGG
jgi:hypothetical protein